MTHPSPQNHPAQAVLKIKSLTRSNLREFVLHPQTADQLLRLPVEATVPLDHVTLQAS